MTPLAPTILLKGQKPEILIIKDGYKNYGAIWKYTAYKGLKNEYILMDNYVKSIQKKRLKLNTN